MKEKANRRRKRLLVTTTEDSNETGTRGVYNTFSRAWADDGGGELAIEGIAKLFSHCIMIWKEGKTWKGQPYIKIHHTKECIQALELESYVDSSFAQKKQKHT